MQSKRVVAGLGVGCVVLAMATALMAAEVKSGQTTFRRTRAVEVTATVEAIDLPKRLVTLKDPKGNVVTVAVDERVKNLPQVEVGDQVMVKLYEAVALRVLAPGEKTSNPSVTSEVTSAQPGQKPAAAGRAEVNVTATIEAINRSAGTVTFKGPEGNSITAKAQDPKNLDLVKVGDKVEITYSQALAISVEKAKKKS